ncbi:MAG: rod shape-determining protein MreD [Candidatus Coatesbacteria bacterium]|nr:rod shape-determining protein MreD [Candidatus Coatesbacteria bacterium]
MLNPQKQSHNVIAYAGLILATITIQTTILHISALGMLCVDLGLIVVIWAGLSKGPRYGMTVGFVVGLLEDSLSGFALGTNSLVKTLVGVFCGVLGRRVLPNSPVTHLITLLLCSLLDYVLLYLLQVFTDPSILNPGRFAMLMMAGVLSTTVVGMLVFRMLTRSAFFRPSRVPDAVLEQDEADAD